jgi:hypothetical protein
VGLSRESCYGVWSVAVQSYFLEKLIFPNPPAPFRRTHDKDINFVAVKGAEKAHDPGN